MNTKIFRDFVLPSTCTIKYKDEIIENPYPICANCEEILNTLANYKNNPKTSTTIKIYNH